MAILFLINFILGILIFNFWYLQSAKKKKKKRKKEKKLLGIFLTGASRTEHGPMDARRTDFLTPTVKSASFFSPRIKVVQIWSKEGAGDRDCHAVVNSFSHGSYFIGSQPMGNHGILLVTTFWTNGDDWNPGIKIRQPDLPRGQN